MEYLLLTTYRLKFIQMFRLFIQLHRFSSENKWTFTVCTVIVISNCYLSAGLVPPQPALQQSSVWQRTSRLGWCRLPLTLSNDCHFPANQSTRWSTSPWQTQLYIKHKMAMYCVFFLYKFVSFVYICFNHKTYKKNTCFHCFWQICFFSGEGLGPLRWVGYKILLIVLPLATYTWTY